MDANARVSRLNGGKETEQHNNNIITRVITVHRSILSVSDMTVESVS